MAQLNGTTGRWTGFGKSISSHRVPTVEAGLLADGIYRFRGGGLEELAVDRNWYSGQRDVAGLVAIQSVRTACVIEVSASVFDSA